MTAMPTLPSLSHATAALVAFADAGQILWTNAHFDALIGGASRTGGSFWELAAGAQKNRIWNEILGGGGGFEVELRRTDGGTLTAEVVLSSHADGAVTLALREVKTRDENAAATVERTLRRQNALLLELARVDAIDAGRLDEAYRAITEAASKGIGCERSSVWLYDQNEMVIVCHNLFRTSEGDHGFQGFTLTAKDYPGYFVALAEDRTIAANDALRHPATREFAEGYLKPLGITSMLEAPIRRGGKLIGVLCHEHVGPARAFTQEETNYAASLADMVTRSLEASARREADENLRTAHAALEQHAAELEERVAERTRAIQLVLDNTGEGILAIDLDGKLSGEHSRTVAHWFETPIAGTDASAFLFGDDAKQAAFLRASFTEFAEDVLPFELIADQSPREIVRGEQILRLRYSPVVDVGALRRVLLIIRDATSEVAAERAERDAREMQALAAHFMRDRRAFFAFVDDLDGLVRDVPHAQTVQARRLLHTIKGNAGTFGIGSLANLAHAIEDESAERGEFVRSMLQPLEARWSEVRQKIQSTFGGDSNSVELTAEEHGAFLADLRRRAVDPALVERVRAWQETRASVVLERLGQQAERIATQLEKRVEVAIEGGATRVPLRELGEVWSSLVHIVRNAVDHGLEGADERVAAGKSATGALRLSVERTANTYVIEVADDGRGIDWSRVRSRAEKLGLPNATHEDLVSAIFADGLSTREHATDLSGRGVGLSAVRAACLARGGHIDVDSAPAKGTRFRFTIPDAVQVARAA